MIQSRFPEMQKSSKRANARVAARGALLGLAFLSAMAGPVQAQLGDKGNRFPLDINPQTPLKELLPTAPDATAVVPPWLAQDLSQVPEVFFQKPDAIQRARLSKARTPDEQDKAFAREQEERARAIEKIAHQIVKINHLNQKETDHFAKLLRENRDDLAGLPFVMGDACRQSKERSRAFVTGVSMVRKSQRIERDEKPPARDAATESNKFWIGYALRNMWKKDRTPEKLEGQEAVPARVAALVQVLAPEDKVFRLGLVKHLNGIDHPEATQALARLAIFSFEAEVRDAALAALKTRPKENTADILIAGLGYPWPAVVKNAGDAIVRLERRDLVGKLVALLDEPDPRAPVERVVNGKKTLAVREVVRLNHHRSCLLCHPPGNVSGADKELQSGGVVTAAIPIPGQPMRSASQGYDPFASPDIFVRADVTYLRQDFSLFQTVKDADPWPTMQRFDFLVRTRAVTAQDTKAYKDWRRQQGDGYLAPHHAAAIAALRALTGLNASEPTAKAWRLALAD